ncbi:hypothetical protein K474DRAFT_1709374, partial [Panus rudis PR-1116 ss-1]
MARVVSPAEPSQSPERENDADPEAQPAGIDPDLWRRVLDVMSGKSKVRDQNEAASLLTKALGDQLLNLNISVDKDENNSGEESRGRQTSRKQRRREDRASEDGEGRARQAARSSTPSSNPPPSRRHPSPDPSPSPSRSSSVSRQNEKSPDSRAKLPPINKGVSVPDYIGNPVAAFATKKIDAVKWVELYYFTARARAAAASSLKASADEAIVLNNKGEGKPVTVKSSAAAEPLKWVVKDRDLSWEELNEAAITFLEEIIRHKWPVDYVQAHHDFFQKIRIHEYRERPLGKSALALYQDKARRDFHRRVDAGDSPPDLAIINRALLDQCMDEVRDIK